MPAQKNSSLHQHITAVKKGERVFENAFQAVSRMVLSQDIDKVVVNGKSTFDFRIFRENKKHIIGMYDEINSFVSFVKDASQGGSSKEMAFVLVGEPGNGKTFLVEYLCGLYRDFLAVPTNRKYTFRFINLDRLNKYGNITTIESQTYEDPMVLAMNLFETRGESEQYLERRYRAAAEGHVEQWFENYRPLGACSAYIWNEIREHCEGKIDDMLGFIEIVPVPLIESLGTITGKYPAKDKITSSAVDLLGEESIQRLLHITDNNNP